MDYRLQDLPPNKLAERIKQGDPAAEEELARRYGTTLLRIILKRCSDRQLSEDIRQDTLLIVLARLREGTLDDPSRLSAFVHRTAINVLIASQRKTIRRGTTTDSSLIEKTRDERFDQLTEIIREESQSAVRNALKGVSNSRDREILYRFYIKDEEKQSICSSLDLSSTHFDRVISRARSRFRKFVESQHPGILELSEPEGAI